MNVMNRIPMATTPGTTLTSVSAEEIAQALAMHGEDVSVERIDQLRAIIGERVAHADGDRIAYVRTVIDTALSAEKHGYRTIEAFNASFARPELERLGFTFTPFTRGGWGYAFSNPAVSNGVGFTDGTSAALQFRTEDSVLHAANETWQRVRLGIPPDVLIQIESSVRMSAPAPLQAPESVRNESQPANSPVPAHTMYNCEDLDDAQLREVCQLALEPGELWRPYVKTEEKDGQFFWKDIEDGAPTRHGPFATERAALLDAVEVEGVEQPENWGIKWAEPAAPAASTTQAPYSPFHALYFDHIEPLAGVRDLEGAARAMKDKGADGYIVANTGAMARYYRFSVQDGLQGEIDSPQGVEIISRIHESLTRAPRALPGLQQSARAARDATDSATLDM
jgi:hypothetical protein